MQDWQDHVSPAGDPPNRHLGRRFDLAGRFLPEAGNTVICQLVPGSASEAALLDLRAALMALPHADHFALTTPASWHMTLFDGVIDSARDADGWATGLPTDTPIETMTAALAARLEGFPALPAFRMAITAVTPMGLQLAGVTPADEAAARAWRDALSDRLGIRRANHATYRLHLTLAYVRRWLPRAALPALAARLDGLTREMRGRLPVLDLARPAFCRFDDMNGFPVVRPL
ncbi:MAG: DUF1868 domain-containing protein [Paracoccaceae bacterium]|nr:MAG: DUF1868 domain-containing protein [Paracoccaceae bacterium]